MTYDLLQVRVVASRGCRGTQYPLLRIVSGDMCGGNGWNFHRNSFLADFEARVLGFYVPFSSVIVNVINNFTLH